MNRRIGVVINPERDELGDDVAARLRALGCEVETTAPSTADGLVDAVDALVADGVDVIAAIGGDGTQRTVGERLAGTDTALAVIPAGTVNLLAQVLGAADLDPAVAAAANGDRRQIDIGHADGDGFVLNASSGWDAAVIGRVDDRTKRWGRVGFVVAGVREWRRSEPTAVEIRLDGDAWFEGGALTVVVMNVGQRGSDALHLAAAAEFDDGRLDVVVLRRHSLLGLIRSGWAIARGRDAPNHHVVTAQAAEIIVEWAEPVATQRDGDDGAPAARITYGVLPERLTVMVPADGS